jgi:phage gp36-like protein
MATPYCSQADLIERFGVVELSQLTDQTAAAGIDAGEVTKACDEATSLIDAYLATRYATPLATTPTMVRKWAVDIARKFLWKDRAMADSVVTLNYDAAMSQLKDVARGVASLPDADGAIAAGSNGAVSVRASDQVFSDDTLSMMP